MRSLCLALPFLESEVKLTAGRGKVGCGREGSMVELNAALQTENFLLKGPTGPSGFQESHFRKRRY